MIPELELLRTRRLDLSKLASLSGVGCERDVAASRSLDPGDPGSVPGESCPECDARLERGDDGKCNRCGEDWPGPVAIETEPQESPQEAGKEAAMRVDVSQLSDLPERPVESQVADWAATKQRAAVNNALYNRTVQLGLTGLGAGVAWRGLQGLLGQLKRKSRKPGESTAEIKMAEETVVLQPRDIPATPTPDRLKSPNAYAAQGYGAETPSQLPWGIPLMGGAALGGAALGWKGVDYLMRRRRQKAVEQETARQRARYESAMSKISKALDDVYEALDASGGVEKVASVVQTSGRLLRSSGLTKSAEPGNARIPYVSSTLEAVGLPASVSPQTAGVGLGVLAGAGGLAALWAHRKAREYAKRRQPGYVLRKAKEDLERDEFLARPVVPVSVVGRDEK